jgi:RND family efflux transporter MFP subunit
MPAPRPRVRRALALTLVLVAACGQAAAPPPPQEAAAPPLQLAAEDVVTIARGALAAGPRISGTLAPSARSVVRAEAPGAVVQIGPELGDRVKAGDLLARIEGKALGEATTSAQAGVAAAQAQLAVARREAQRVESLVKGGALAQRELERAQSQIAAAESSVGQAQAQLAASRSQLGDATARAPFAGVIARRAVSRGDVVAPGAELYEVIDPSTMRLDASVVTDDLTAIAPGKAVAFTVRGYPGQHFTGAIARVAPIADPVTRQIQVIVEIPNAGHQLIAGLYAEGRIAVGSREGVIAPLAAIDLSGDQPTALRVSRGAVERVTVSLGLRDERAEVVEIVGGLAPGDVVVAARVGKRLAPGTRVQLPAAAPRAAPAEPARQGSSARAERM